MGYSALRFNQYQLYGYFTEMRRKKLIATGVVGTTAVAAGVAFLVATGGERQDLAQSDAGNGQRIHACLQDMMANTPRVTEGDVISLGDGHFDLDADFTFNYRVLSEDSTLGIHNPIRIANVIGIRFDNIYAETGTLYIGSAELSKRDIYSEGVEGPDFQEALETALAELTAQEDVDSGETDSPRERLVLNEVMECDFYHTDTDLEDCLETLRNRPAERAAAMRAVVTERIRNQTAVEETHEHTNFVVGIEAPPGEADIILSTIDDGTMTEINGAITVMEGEDYTYDIQGIIDGTVPRIGRCFGIDEGPG